MEAIKEEAIEPTLTLDRLTTEEWLAKGKKLFGKDPKGWKFKCPCCGHIQTIADFIELRELGLWSGDAQTAYFSCIGRYDTRIPVMKKGGLLDKGNGSPCDYTLGGLIRLHKTVVVDGEGEENPVFEFATTEEGA